MFLMVSIWISLRWSSWLRQLSKPLKHKIAPPYPYFSGHWEFIKKIPWIPTHAAASLLDPLSKVFSGV